MSVNSDRRGFFAEVGLKPSTLTDELPWMRETRRRVVIVRALCSLAFGLQTVLCLLTFVLPLVFTQTLRLNFFSICTVATTAGYGLILWNIKPTNYYLCSRFLVSLAMLFIGVLYIQSILGPTSNGHGPRPLLVGFIIPISIAVALLKPYEAMYFTFAATLYSLILHLYQIFAVAPPTDAEAAKAWANVLGGITFFDAVLMPFVGAILIIPTMSLSRATETLERQAAQLSEALGALENRQALSLEVSQQVLGMTSELNATANQQAAGSQEQAAVVAQVDSSMTELSQTASNIEHLTDQVVVAAKQVSSVTEEITETSSLSFEQSSQGLAATARTVAASQEVTALYGHLLDDLNQLTGKNKNMRVIVEVLGSLMSQTHLLALNASIEAVGAGEYGERFMVVAQEVKQLANQSAEAQKQIVGIIREIEQTASQAQHRAAEGYDKATVMTDVAHEAGEVIANLRKVAAHSQTQADSISQAVGEVKQLMTTVRVATAQQNSASQSVSYALKSLSVVATQTALSSQQVAETALSLESLSGRLSSTLARKAA